MNKTEIIAEYVRGVASQGGTARAKSLTARRRKSIARKAANARWAKWRACKERIDTERKTA